MKTIQLIVTGAMEFKCLHLVMESLFPRDAAREEVRWLPPKMTGAFTSCAVEEYTPGHTVEVTPPRDVDKRTPLEKLADLALIVGRHEGENACDLVLVVEDLELVNAGRALTVANVFKEAIQARAVGNGLEAVLPKVSFHLFGFMPENYFVADPGFWAKHSVRNPPLWSPSDLEHTNYRGHQPNHTWDTKLESKPTWRSHAKRVITHYLGEVDMKIYHETSDGAEALQEMNWPALRTATDSDLPLISALFTDLDDFLGVNKHPFQNHRPSEATWRRNAAGTAPCTIRNI